MNKRVVVIAWPMCNTCVELIDPDKGAAIILSPDGKTHHRDCYLKSMGISPPEPKSEPVYPPLIFVREVPPVGAERFTYDDPIEHKRISGATSNGVVYITAIDDTPEPKSEAQELADEINRRFSEKCCIRAKRSECGTIRLTGFTPTADGDNPNSFCITLPAARALMGLEEK